MYTLARIGEKGPEKSSFLVYFTRRESEDVDRDFVCRWHKMRGRGGIVKGSIYP